MSKQKSVGVFQLDNGFWGYRYSLVINGKTRTNRRTKDDFGNPFKTKTQAVKAREKAIFDEKAKNLYSIQREYKKITVEEIFNEYCEKGRSGKALGTILKQDSLWKNHLKKNFGAKFIDEITLAEIQDYLAELYYVEGRAYTYVESFLKMFYLIYGQAYSRDYIDVKHYNKMCLNKATKIHMPKRKINEDDEIVYFNNRELEIMDKVFKGTNAETAYMLGKYCGLRINECYGLKWENIDFENGTITIDRQMYYDKGVIRLLPVKTRNSKRKIYMCEKLKGYLLELKEKKEQDEKQFSAQREQRQIYLEDMDGKNISSLELVNTLPNGKIQTINSMKYHSRKLESEYNIPFKYHYLRHTYGTKLAVLNTPTHLLCNQMGHSSSNVTQKYYIAMSEEGIDMLLDNLDRF